MIGFGLQNRYESVVNLIARCGHGGQVGTVGLAGRPATWGPWTLWAIAIMQKRVPSGLELLGSALQCPPCPSHAPPTVPLARWVHPSCQYLPLHGSRKSHFDPLPVSMGPATHNMPKQRHREKYLPSTEYAHTKHTQITTKQRFAPYKLMHRISSIYYRISSDLLPYRLSPAPYKLRALPYKLRHCTV